MTLLKIGKKTFEIDKKTIIMGILNVTPDSFSDGGDFFSFKEAINHAIRMEKEGADIIDIGGESTRPGANSVSFSEEYNRVIPVIEELVKKIKIPISVDTYKSKIAKKALEIGASMINDVTALRGDKNLPKIIAEYNVPVCLMHMKGMPKDMQKNPIYKDVIDEIHDFLKIRSNYAISCGIKKENIIIDPGIGFGKRTGRGIEDNCLIINRLSEIKSLGFPIMIGASRKTFIGNICGKAKRMSPDKRLEGSLAAAGIAACNGADIVRVHDVKETRMFFNVLDCIVRN
jgi:dihydropteroate synthase